MAGIPERYSDSVAKSFPREEIAEMMTKRQKAIVLGFSGLLPILLGGCGSPETVKPGVRTASVKPSATYVIQRASIHTPATERAWQGRKAARASQLAAKRAQLLSVKRPTPAAPVKAATKPTSQRPHQQTLSRAHYQARYEANQLAAKKRMAANAKYQARAAQIAREKLAKNKAQLALQKIRQAEWKNNQARLAQQKVKQTHQQKRKVATARVIQKSRKPVTTQVTQKTADSKRQFYLARWEQLQADKRLEARKADVRVERVINNAKKQIGTKYVWGGASPKTGFDCSGLVQHSMKQGANVKVPRTAAEQYKASVKVPAKQASRGDLIFFKTRGKSVSHVGIYLGKNKFVHAPRTGRRITTSKLSGYWKQRFVGFGRIPGACKLTV